jgi:hypothetical protein
VLTIGGIVYRMGLAPDQASAPFEFGDHAKVQLTFPGPPTRSYYTAAQVVAARSPYEVSSTGRTYSTVYPPGRVFPASTAVSGLLAVTNRGAVDVWPVIRVRGPLATSFRIEDMTTGEAFAMTLDHHRRRPLPRGEHAHPHGPNRRRPQPAPVLGHRHSPPRHGSGPSRATTCTGSSPARQLPAPSLKSSVADPFLWPDDTEDP